MRPLVRRAHDPFMLKAELTVESQSPQVIRRDHEFHSSYALLLQPIDARLEHRHGQAGPLFFGNDCQWTEVGSVRHTTRQAHRSTETFDLRTRIPDVERFALDKVVEYRFEGCNR